MRHRPRPGTRITCRAGDRGEGPDLAHSLINVSDTGARLCVSGPAEAGVVVEVTFLPPGGQRLLRRAATVVWSREVGAGEHQAGVLFAKALSATELREL